MRLHVHYLFLALILFPNYGKTQTYEGTFREVDSIIEAYVKNRTIPGAVILISEYGEILHSKAFGYAQIYKFGGAPLDSPPMMTINHSFDLASLTKVFATTFGIMLLVDQETVDLDTPVHHYLPRFRGRTKDSITVRHLLSHSAGLYPWKPVYYHARTATESLKYICELPLAYPVGVERHYSDLGFMLLGYLIESVSGQTLNAYLKHTLYDKLGLTKTTFNPTREQVFAMTSHGNPFEKRMVADNNFGYKCDENPNAFTAWRRYVLEGEVNDGNAFYAHQGIAGHAGLFSTVGELKILLDLLLNKGSSMGKQIISKSVVETFLTKDSFGHGLGWAMSSDVLPANNWPEGTFGHTGFTGTYVLGIPSTRMSLILLTNRQNLGVNKDGNYNALGKLRRGIGELIFKE
jgi:CubicO group peptidase (beta-lactamase class C family)